MVRRSSTTTSSAFFLRVSRAARRARSWEERETPEVRFRFGSAPAVDDIVDGGREGARDGCRIELLQDQVGLVRIVLGERAAVVEPAEFRGEIGDLVPGRLVHVPRGDDFLDASGLVGGRLL